MVMDKVKMRCESCAWYDDAETRCRFNPPTMDGFPLVLDDDWCRQWAATRGRLPLRDEPRTTAEIVKDIRDGLEQGPRDRIGKQIQQRLGRNVVENPEYLDEQSDGDRAVRMSEVVAAQAAEIAKDVKAMRDDQLADNLQEVRREAERYLDTRSRQRGMAAELTRDLDKAMPWRKPELDTSELRPGGIVPCKDPRNVTQDEIDAATGTQGTGEDCHSPPFA